MKNTAITHILLGTVLMMVSFSLSSCGEDFFSTTVEIDIPKEDPKLVVGGIISTADTTMNLYISQSEPTIGKIQERPDMSTAKVTLTDGEDTYLFTYVDQNYNFTSSRVPRWKEGTSYTLTVEKPNLATATSTVTIPTAQSELKTKVIKSAGVDDEGDPISAIEVIFDNEPGVEECYMVRVLGRQGGILSERTPGLSYSFDRGYVIFQDKAFDGKRHKITLYLTGVLSDSINYFLEWHKISPDHYDYDKRISRQQDVGDNPFSSLIPLSTNIEGGLGLFAITNVTWKKLDVK